MLKNWPDRGVSLAVRKKIIKVLVIDKVLVRHKRTLLASHIRIWPIVIIVYHPVAISILDLSKPEIWSHLLFSMVLG